MIVQGFWHGNLGTMEKMCINSYLKQGHVFHLFSYPSQWQGISLDILKAPGFKLRDAKNIVPEDRIRLFPWVSIFSDFFRYALLNKNGGWWVDMDTICLKPFDDLTADYVFARDNLGHDDRYVTGFVMKTPPSAPIMWHSYNWINDMSQEERSKLGHMDIGPNLLQRKVPEYGLQSYIAEKKTFDPIPWDHIKEIVDPERAIVLAAACQDSYVIHLRQSIWDGGPNCAAGVLSGAGTPNQVLLRTDEEYPDTSLWELLKRKYL